MLPTATVRRRCHAVIMAATETTFPLSFPRKSPIWTAKKKTLQGTPFSRSNIASISWQG